MPERKKLFVLVVEHDRIVAATLARILQPAGYMVGTAESHVAALRIAARMVIDAAVIDAGKNPKVNIETAAAVQDQYPKCRVLLVCAHSQAEETAMLAQEAGLACEILARPLSRSQLLAKLASSAASPGPTPPVTRVQAA